MRTYLAVLPALLLPLVAACDRPVLQGSLPSPAMAARPATAACPTAPPHGTKVERAFITINGQPTIGTPTTFNIGLLAYDAQNNIICGAFTKPFSLTLTDSQSPPRVALRGSTLSSSASFVVLRYYGRGDRFVLRAANGEAQPVVDTITTAAGATTELTGSAAAGADWDPNFLAFDQSGNLWTTLSESSRTGIGEIASDGAVRPFYVPASDIVDSPVIASSGAYRWVAYTGADNQNHLARISAVGEFKDVKLPALAQEPITPVAGENGDLWFTSDLDVYVSDASGNVELAGTVPLRQGQPGAIYLVLDPHHRGMWFSFASEVGLINRSGGIANLHAFPQLRSCLSGSVPFATGRDGNFWAPYPCDKDALLRFDTNGIETSYSRLPEPPLDSFIDADDVATDRQGNLFIPDQEQHGIVRVTPDGVVTEYTAATTFNRTPQQVVRGADGFMYIPVVSNLPSQSPRLAIEKFDPKLW